MAPGAAAVLDDAQKQRIIAMVCSNPPEGRARWTVRLVAQEAVKRRLVPRVGRETVRILLLDHELKPWRKKMWCVAELIEGRHFTFATPDRSGLEFARVACQLAMHYRDADTVHLVLDNLNVHCLKSLTDAFGMEMGCEVWDRFTIHFTPKRGSWLNQAEIVIGLLSRQCLGKRRIPNLTSLRRESRAWNRRMNRDKIKLRLTGSSIAELPDAGSVTNATLQAIIELGAD